MQSIFIFHLFNGAAFALISFNIFRLTCIKFCSFCTHTHTHTLPCTLHIVPREMESINVERKAEGRKQKTKTP